MGCNLLVRSKKHIDRTGESIEFQLGRKHNSKLIFNTYEWPSVTLARALRSLKQYLL